MADEVTTAQAYATRYGLALTPALQAASDEAVALVDQYVAGFPDVTIPDVIKARAVAEATSALIARDQAPNGIAQVSDGMGGITPVRVPYDPLRTVYPILAAWTGPVIA